MPGRRHSPDEITALLRRARELRAQGVTAKAISRELGISENTFQRWIQVYAGLDGRQKRRLIELAEENRRLKQLVANLSLELQTSHEYAQSLEDGAGVAASGNGNFQPGSP